MRRPAGIAGNAPGSSKEAGTAGRSIRISGGGRKELPQAVNAKLQGSAAALIKIAMVRLDQQLEAGMDLVLSVHDELVVRTPEDRAEECAGIMRSAMLGDGIQALVKVPLSADVKIVDRWSEAK